MNEERLLILKMVAEGRLTPEEAEQLLAALEGSLPEEPPVQPPEAALAEPPEAAPAAPSSPQASPREPLDRAAELRASLRGLRVSLRGLRRLKDLSRLERLTPDIGVRIGEIVEQAVQETLAGLKSGREPAMDQQDGVSGSGPGAPAAGAAWSWTVVRGRGAWHKTLPDMAGKTLRISTLGGDIRVQGWDKPYAEVTARSGGMFVSWLGPAPEEWQIAAVPQPGNQSTMELALYPGRSGDPPDHIRGDCDWEVYVPFETDLLLECKSGDVTVENVRGQKLDAYTLSGDLGLRQVQCREAHLRSVSGDIRVEGAAQQVLSASDSSGDITLRLERAESGQISASTTSGDIRIHVPVGASFTYDLSTASGDLWVPQDGQVEEATSRRRRGRVGAGGGLTITARTTSGDLSVSVGE